MAKTPESPADLNKASVEAALSFARVSTESAEKLMRLHLEAARNFVAEQSETVKALAEVKDAESTMALRARLAEQAVDRAVGYSRNVYEVAMQSQQQLTRLIEQHYAAYQKEMVAAMDSMTKAAKQAAELMDANVKAVSEAAASAFKGGVKKK